MKKSSMKEEKLVIFKKKWGYDKEDYRRDLT